MRLPHESKEELLEDAKIWELLEQWGFDKVCSRHCGPLLTTADQLQPGTQSHLYLQGSLGERVLQRTRHTRGRCTAPDAPVHRTGTQFWLPRRRSVGLEAAFDPFWGCGPVKASSILSGRKARPHQEAHSESKTFWSEADKKAHCIALGQIICETDPERARQMHAEVRGKR